MWELLWKYIIGPIVADARGVEQLVWKGTTAVPGYNSVNTFFYAVAALTVIYLIYRLLQEKEFDITSSTAIYSTPFIVLGGALRFLDDAQLIPFPYSIVLITPIIYLVIASIFLPLLYKLEDLQLAKVGTVMLIPVLAYSATAFQSINLIYVLGTAIGTFLLTAVYYTLFKEEYVQKSLILLVFTQVFEGMASMLSTFYGYNPKQLLAQLATSVLGFPGILLMKITVLALAVSMILDMEDEKLKSIALIMLYSVGLGTGFRVFLRVAAGL